MTKESEEMRDDMEHMWTAMQSLEKVCALSLDSEINSLKQKIRILSHNVAEMEYDEPGLRAAGLADFKRGMRV